MHPVRVVTTLVQFGYEPVEATRQFSVILRRHFYYYPGLYGYAKAIANERGWRALYRGVIPAIIEEIVTPVAADSVRPIVHSIMSRLPLQEVPYGNEESPDNVQNLTTTRATLVRATKGFFVLTLSKCAVEIITRPFHVITMRAIAQHVGKETTYSSIYRAVRQIIADEGIRGLYAGLTPALLYHVANSLLYELILVILEESAKLVPFAILSAGLVTIKVPVASYITRSYTYPFTLIGNLMAINNTRLAAAALNPHFSTWWDCWNRLKESGNFYRGNVVFLPRFAYNHPLNKI